MTDAFAAAAEAHAAQSSTATPAASPAASETVKADMSALTGLDTPFLTSSEVNTGGDFGPRVPFEDIIGRLVVMVPQAFTEKAPKMEQFRKSADDLYQAIADVDLFVLDGGPFTYEYAVPAEGSTDPNAKEYKTHEVTELPYGEKMRRIFNGGLAWTVKRAMDQRGILLGVMSYGPQNKKAAQAGATIDSVSAAMQQWIARGRKGDSPKFTYVLDDRPHMLTPERRAVAGDWWSEYRKTLGS